jgi:hypothetical protein
VCQESAAANDVRAALPHPVAGSAADPIALEPVDGVVVTTLVDNVYDALLTGDDTITRAMAAGTAQAPQFEPGEHSTPRYPTAGSKAAAAPATSSPLPDLPVATVTDERLEIHVFPTGEKLRRCRRVGTAGAGREPGQPAASGRPARYGHHRPVREFSGAASRVRRRQRSGSWCTARS